MKSMEMITPAEPCWPMHAEATMAMTDVTSGIQGDTWVSPTPPKLAMYHL
jgi:hypothetical protein